MRRWAIGRKESDRNCPYFVPNSINTLFCILYKLQTQRMHCDGARSPPVSCGAFASVIAQSGFCATKKFACSSYGCFVFATTNGVNGRCGGFVFCFFFWRTVYIPSNTTFVSSILSHVAKWLGSFELFVRFLLCFHAVVFRVVSSSASLLSIRFSTFRVCVCFFRTNLFPSYIYLRGSVIVCLYVSILRLTT